MRYGLVGDIGGTNARFALIDLENGGPPELLDEHKLLCAQYPSIDSAIEAYITGTNRAELSDIEAASIAVAGTVGGDNFSMTNNHWQFSISAVLQRLGVQRLDLLNDFAAIAWSIPLLTEQQLITVGGGCLMQGHPVAVIGPGTGLGVGGYVQTAAGISVLETEGGHASFAPGSEREIQVLSYLLNEFSRVSNERLLSGPGLENIYAAIAGIDRLSLPPRSAADITAAALEQQDTFCIEALNHFCAILGSVAGDLALTLGAKGGVYIAGGIVPRLIDFFQQSPFRRRFEAKGRFQSYNANIATRVIIAEHPGLLGAAAHLTSNQ